MPQITGKAGITKKFSAVVSPGTEISFPYPVKSFIIKPVGGSVTFKFNSTDDDADAFPLSSGEAISIDCYLPYPIATNTATIGIATGVSGTVDVYVIVTY